MTLWSEDVQHCTGPELIASRTPGNSHVSMTTQFSQFRPDMFVAGDYDNTRYGYTHIPEDWPDIREYWGMSEVKGEMINNPKSMQPCLLHI